VSVRARSHQPQAVNQNALATGTDWLNGALRLIYIVGDPIAQVKSPAGVTRVLQERGQNVVVVPAHVSAARLGAWWHGVKAMQNLHGAIVTIPHKFAATALCDTLSPRASFLQAVNILRCEADGRWHGDMFDGLGYVQGMAARGHPPAGKRVLLVGAGGAGSAIGHALVSAGAASLSVYDDDGQRQHALVARLAALGLCHVYAGPPDPAGFDVVLNATPAGMTGHAPLPIATQSLANLAPSTFVGCVVTQPVITPLIEAARGLGCPTMTGADMFAHVRDLMVEFLVGKL
jgi:shikimate dehydrogenase